MDICVIYSWECVGGGQVPCCLWRPGEDIRWPSVSLSTLFPCDRFVHWTWSEAGSQWHSDLLCPSPNSYSIPRVTDVCSQAWFFIWVLGIRTYVLMLAALAFSHTEPPHLCHWYFHRRVRTGPWDLACFICARLSSESDRIKVLKQADKQKRLFC